MMKPYRDCELMDVKFTVQKDIEDHKEEVERAMEDEKRNFKKHRR